jgi:hypothetical protein
LLRAREDDLGLRAFHELAGVHHGNLVGPLSDETKIVRDEQDGHAEPLLELADQFQDLSLDRDVECRVGSSAIRSLGVQASAIAIMTRWRCPPENWCGKFRTRFCGSAILTRRSKHSFQLSDVLS